jgi:hypothetical protein
MQAQRQGFRFHTNRVSDALVGASSSRREPRRGARAQIHGSRCVRNAVKALVHGFESQRTLREVVGDLQPRDGDPGRPALRVTELAARHYRGAGRRMPGIGGAWYKAPKQARPNGTSMHAALRQELGEPGLPMLVHRAPSTNLA